MRVLFIGGAGAIAAPMVSALATAKRQGENVELFLLGREGGTLEALRHQGIRVAYAPEANNRKDMPVPPEVRVQPGEYTLANDPTGLGKPMDFIVLGLKATEVDVAKLDELRRARAIGPNTLIATLQNGLPIWLPLTPEAQNNAIDYLDAVDPGGRIARNYGKNLVGGFTAAAARQMKEGKTPIAASSLVTGDYSYFFGAPEGPDSPKAARVKAFVNLLNKGGLNAQARDDIGLQAILKLLGNTPLNAISALTNATLSQIASDPQLSKFALEVMAEVREVAAALGIQGAKDLNLEHRLKAAGKLTHRPSMWADVHGGKMPEIDALLGGVIELAERLDMRPEKTRNVRALFHAMEDLAKRELNGAYVTRPGNPWNRTPPWFVADVQKRIQGLPQLAKPAPA